MVKCDLCDPIVFQLSGKYWIESVLQTWKSNSNCICQDSYCDRVCHTSACTTTDIALGHGLALTHTKGVILVTARVVRFDHSFPRWVYEATAIPWETGCCPGPIIHSDPEQCLSLLVSAPVSPIVFSFLLLPHISARFHCEGTGRQLKVYSQTSTGSDSNSSLRQACLRDVGLRGGTQLLYMIWLKYLGTMGRNPYFTDFLWGLPSLCASWSQPRSAQKKWTLAAKKWNCENLCLTMSS